MSKVCSGEGCDRTATRKGMCDMHYQRVKAANRPVRLCACGCGELTAATFVSGHHTRLFPPEEQARRGRMNNGDKQRDRGGADWYRKVRGRHEHRIVAEKKLGRPLCSNEIIHHKNGNKKDNHPENLEVMSRSEHIREHLHDMHRARAEKKRNAAT